MIACGRAAAGRPAPPVATLQPTACERRRGAACCCAGGYAGYWPANFYKINPAFGTEAQLVELVQLYHQRGMLVLFDLVINHVGYGNWQTFYPFNKTSDFHDCNGARENARRRWRRRPHTQQRDSCCCCRPRARRLLHAQLRAGPRRPVCFTTHQRALVRALPAVRAARPQPLRCALAMPAYARWHCICHA